MDSIPNKGPDVSQTNTQKIGGALCEQNQKQLVFVLIKHSSAIATLIKHISRAMCRVCVWYSVFCVLNVFMC